MTDSEKRETLDRAHDDQEFHRAADRGPDSPGDLPKPHWKSVLKRTVAEFGEDGGSDLAAALTYFAIMSLAPMLLALSTSLSFLGQGEATQTAVTDLGGELGLQQETIDTVTGYLNTMGDSGGAGLLLIVGLLGALWSASNYVNAFSRMMNKVYEIEEGRPVWKLRPMLVGLTVVILVMLMTIVLAITLSGTVSELIFGAIGLSGTANTIWNIAKWPFILLMLIAIVALLYWGTPNIRQPKFRWLSPGAALAVVVAIIAAAGFGIYVANFGNYNETYGAIGGVIVLLLLIFIINNVLVLGAELDAELERGRELAAGMAAEETIQLPPRDTKGTEKKVEKSEKIVQEARQLRMEAARDLDDAGEDRGLPGRGRDVDAR
ncbi:YihY/virulence factor BrkB family protein [Ornithinimicrobium pekingense]|uniref:Ribonuclease n=1 Tax=Ornithinimicrobium pekingense TaxID=384677 RepID=A0ABQ2F4I5_9MICO|nr:YihY/virulence factor BrkB family protein [Ornithinimicrobium pekingense]GGK59036.1 ribonuclease [Ornithinimicrobium pekingense]